MTRSRCLLSLALIALATTAALGRPHARPHAKAHSGLTASAINAAEPGKGSDAALVVKAEVLLDRNHDSPGAIDGRNGDNFRKALTAFQQLHGLAATGTLDQDTWNALASKDPAITDYVISETDVAMPFQKKIPRKLEQMAALPGLSYRDPAEELAEKFHMSESLLRDLNPGARFDQAGTKIAVANVQPMNLRDGHRTVEAARPKAKESGASKVATIVVDKPAREVRAYAKDGALVAFYPATIGSEEKPAPSGTFAVRRVAWNPDYHYDPKFAWKGVKTRRKLTLRPGPNNPVGLVWIDLSAPSYGIHGTPEPDKIGKTESHGCIRLTNWDALDLAGMVHKGTVVKFEDQDSPVVPQAQIESSRRGGS